MFGAVYPKLYLESIGRHVLPTQGGSTWHNADLMCSPSAHIPLSGKLTRGAGGVLPLAGVRVPVEDDAAGVPEEAGCDMVCFPLPLRDVLSGGSVFSLSVIELTGEGPTLAPCMAIRLKTSDHANHHCLLLLFLTYLRRQTAILAPELSCLATVTVCVLHQNLQHSHKYGKVKRACKPSVLILQAQASLLHGEYKAKGSSGVSHHGRLGASNLTLAIRWGYANSAQ